MAEIGDIGGSRKEAEQEARKEKGGVVVAPKVVVPTGALRAMVPIGALEGCNQDRHLLREKKSSDGMIPMADGYEEDMRRRGKTRVQSGSTFAKRKGEL
ncbi:hypothetical protein COCNU_06G016340 [Cocos nucifera]|uniref:Uncharacterized protein n=1 Tax=Cocos nucifera TaxID=13894 RepID=A0A8K0ID30_COCNU|nr:hypothetical protein COCNU_06G016340 [Cocos nucifera]